MGGGGFQLSISIDPGLVGMSTTSQRGAGIEAAGHSDLLRQADGGPKVAEMLVFGEPPGGEEDLEADQGCASRGDGQRGVVEGDWASCGLLRALAAVG